jgi:hypothetical protein
MDPMTVPHTRLARSPLSDLWLQNVSPRRPSREDRGFLSKPPEGHGAPGDQVAPSQSPDALDHLTHGRSRPKGGVPPGLKSVTPRRVRQTLARVTDQCDIGAEKGSTPLPLGPNSQVPLSHQGKRPHAGQHTPVSRNCLRHG